MRFDAPAVESTFPRIEGGREVVLGLSEHLDRLGSAGARVAQDQPRLDRTVPEVPLEAEGRVDRLIRLDAQLPVAPERDRARIDPARADHEPQVASVPHRTRVAQAR